MGDDAALRDKGLPSGVESPKAARCLGIAGTLKFGAPSAGVAGESPLDGGDGRRIVNDIFWEDEAMVDVEPWPFGMNSRGVQS